MTVGELKEVLTMVKDELVIFTDPRKENGEKTIIPVNGVKVYMAEGDTGIIQFAVITNKG